MTRVAGPHWKILDEPAQIPSLAHLAALAFHESLRYTRSVDRRLCEEARDILWDGHPSRCCDVVHRHTTTDSEDMYRWTRRGGPIKHKYYRVSKEASQGSDWQYAGVALIRTEHTTRVKILGSCSKPQGIVKRTKRDVKLRVRWTCEVCEGRFWRSVDKATSYYTHECKGETISVSIEIIET